jgi:RHS repeat-associated protein
VTVFDTVPAAERRAFFPYGEERTSTPALRYEVDKYATYNRSWITGLDYANQRYYDSATGRFVTPDPGDAGDLDDPQSLNLYTYVNNDPINFNDPEGTTVNIPLEDGGSPTSCLNYKLEPWMKSHGFSVGDNFGDFGNTAVGTLGITLYYESTGGSTQFYQQVAQVMANRYWLARLSQN